MRLIDHQQKILREEIQKCIRRISLASSGYMSGIVFYTLAKAGLSQHLQIIACTLLQSVCLDKLALTPHKGQLLLKLLLYSNRSLTQLSLRGGIMSCREDTGILPVISDLAADIFNFRYLLDLITEEADSCDNILRAGREYIKCISSDTEAAALGLKIIAAVLYLNKLSYYLIPVLAHTRTQRHHKTLIILWISQTVYTRH